MRKYILIISSFLFSAYAVSQQTITKLLNHDGLEREYILYVPNSYDETVDVPLLFNFHGYTSNATEQMVYADFRSIADSEGFIIVHPEGALFNGQTHWNVGGWTLGSDVDDIGFTEKMIEEISSEYNIDAKRIYATGMSNGGFMSFLLACQLSDKIAAIASVTGSMTPSTFNNCDPNHPIPVLYIHGNVDSVVPYGGAIWTKKVEDVLSYWQQVNECDSDPVFEGLPDTNAFDGSTVEKISYLNGKVGAEVIHFKVLGGDHTWPGTIFNTPGTNQDINASKEIWKFLSRYDINGIIKVETSVNQNILAGEVQIYPNPASSELNVIFDHKPSLEYKLLSLNGEVLENGIFTQQQEYVDISKLNTGSYFLKIGNKEFKVVKLKQ